MLNLGLGMDYNRRIFLLKLKQRDRQINRWNKILESQAKRADQLSWQLQQANAAPGFWAKFFWKILNFVGILALGYIAFIVFCIVIKLLYEDVELQNGIFILCLASFGGQR